MAQGQCQHYVYRQQRHQGHASHATSQRAMLGGLAVTCRQCTIHNLLEEHKHNMSDLQ